MAFALIDIRVWVAIVYLTFVLLYDSFLVWFNKGMNPFVPTLDQVQAAGNQSDFYMYVWENDQASLQAHYLQQFNCSDDDSACRSDAFNRSINEATGSGSCSLNTGGTAWFWFTGETKKVAKCACMSSRGDTI